MSVAAPSTAACTAAPSAVDLAMREYRKRVGAWIANNRRVLQLSAEEIGAALDRSGSTIRNWENGIGNITLFDAYALRGYFSAKWTQFDRRHIVTPEEIAVRDLPLLQVPGFAREA